MNELSAWEIASSVFALVLILRVLFTMWCNSYEEKRQAKKRWLLETTHIRAAAQLVGRSNMPKGF